jgi:hypothetical protein
MHTDCSEVILAFEAPLAFTAPVLAPVAILMHVSFGCCQGVEHGVATLAVEFRAPVAVLIHMLTGGILCPIKFVAGFALPMAYSVHVLLCGMPVTKCPVTSFVVDHINCKAAKFEKKAE